MTSLDPRVDALCKQPNWHLERLKLREIALECGLSEAVKWDQLCYTYNNSNLAIIFAMKDYCGLGFFKGALLSDPKKILHRQGKHSQAMRLIRFTSLEELNAQEAVVIAFVREAVAVEKSGLKIDFKEKHNLALPAELQARLNKDAAFRTAFEALTPGRQRAEAEWKFGGGAACCAILVWWATSPSVRHHTVYDRG